MNIDIKEIAFDLEKINKNLEYLTKQLEKNNMIAENDINYK